MWVWIEQIWVWLGSKPGKVFRTGWHQCVAFGAKELSISSRTKGVSDVRDVIHSAVRLTDAFDRDGPVRFEDVRVVIAVNLAFRVEKPLCLVIQLLTQGGHFRYSCGGIHADVHLATTHVRR